MRKELVFCSALILSASLAGCGYDDGSLESLSAIAETCTTNFDCKSGNAIVGECVQGKCLRFCSIDTASDDCELDTVCEAGLCRPVVPCPELQLSNRDDVNEYKDKKCIQVFSTTPDISWANLLSTDVVVDTEQTRNSASAEDFASSNYDLAVPHESLYAGMNFSVVTIAAITYLRLLVTSATLVAQCTKPEVPSFDDAGNVTWTSLEDAAGYTYQASYEYKANDDPMNMKNLLSICNGGVTGMNNDMSEYVNYLMETGINGQKITDIDRIIEQYVYMIQNKPICQTSQMLLQILEGVSSVILEMGMSSTLESSTLVGAQQMLAWLKNSMDYQFIYDNSKQIYDQNINIGEGEDKTRVDRLGVYPVVPCTPKTWKKNAQANALLASNMKRHFAVDDNAIDWDTGTADFTRAKEYITYCNEKDVGQDVTRCDTKEDNCAQVDDKYYIFNQGKAIKAMNTQIRAGGMQSQLHSCIFMITGMEKFPLLQALASSDDMKFSKCANNEYRISAMLDITKFQGDTNKQMLLSVLQGNSSALTEIKQDFVNSISVFADKNVIYTQFTDPTMIWLSGYSYMPLEIREKSQDYNKNDLILQINYSSVDDLFKPSASSSGSAITGPVSLSVVPDMYVKRVETNNPNLPRYEVTKNNKYDSKIVYQSGEVNQFVSSVVRRSGVNDADSSSCQNCRFYFYAEKQNPNVPMVCGGFTYKTNQINGYIVLTNDDLNNRSGNRDITRVQK